MYFLLVSTIVINNWGSLFTIEATNETLDSSPSLTGGPARPVIHKMNSSTGRVIRKYNFDILSEPYSGSMYLFHLFRRQLMLSKRPTINCKSVLVDWHQPLFSKAFISPHSLWSVSLHRCLSSSLIQH